MKKFLSGRAKLKDIFRASKFRTENYKESGKIFILIMKCSVLININPKNVAGVQSGNSKNKLYQDEITNMLLALLPLQPELIISP